MTDSSTTDFVGDFAYSSLSDGATPVTRARPMNYLLNRFKTRNAPPPTHLFLSGGSLTVPAADDGSVTVAVAQCELQGEFGYVVELRTPYFRLFFDLDYSSYRILSEDDAAVLLRDAVLPVIAECYPHATPHERRVILLSAPPLPVDKSTCVCIQDKTPVRARLFKSGFHLVFPDLIVDDEHALMVRRALVERLQLLLPKDFDHDGVRCTTWGDVLDECVFTKCGFRAVYQRKADKCAHCMPCTRTPRCLLATAACMPCEACTASLRCACRGTRYIDYGRPYRPFGVLDGDGTPLPDEMQFLQNPVFAAQRTSIRCVACTTCSPAEPVRPTWCVSWNAPGPTVAPRVLRSTAELQRSLPTHSRHLSSDDLAVFQTLVREQFVAHEVLHSAVALLDVHGRVTRLRAAGTSRFCTRLNRAHSRSNVKYYWDHDCVWQECFSHTNGCASAESQAWCYHQRKPANSSMYVDVTSRYQTATPIEFVQ